jgi:predicted nucleic acid-binding protein
VIVFADSSAVVKLYADEQDHQLVRGLDGLVVSALARVEVPSAIWRKHRMGKLTSADAAVLVAAFEADYHGSADDQPHFAVVAASANVLETAARLAAVHGLRAYDAVQLASAKAAAQAVPDCHTMTAFDGTLRTSPSPSTATWSACRFGDLPRQLRNRRCHLRPTRNLGHAGDRAVRGGRSSRCP